MKLIITQEQLKRISKENPSMTVKEFIETMINKR